MNGQMRDIVESLRREWTARSADPEEVARVAQLLACAMPPRSLTEALSEDALALIVEPKRNPGRKPGGDLERLVEIVVECQQGGATAISLVTRPELSRGTLDDLEAARPVATVPVIARDLVVHPLQVRELRAAGADVIFLPVSIYADVELEPDVALPSIVREAQSLAMEVVLSIQESSELELALDAEPDVLNIDNRRDDGRIDVERTLDLLAEVPVGTPVISESVAHGAEVAQLQRAGVDGLLLDEGHLEQGLTSALAVFATLTLD